jgi:1-acyl-sn-glycerol-3-phosphate acyltransferase
MTLALWTDPQIPLLGPSVPRAHGRLAAAIGRFMMGVRGWRVEGAIPDLPKMVMVVAPHTSNWDFSTGLWPKLALRLDVRFVGKHTLFRWPLGPVMRWLGGVPVNRSAAAGFVREVGRMLREADRMLLVIAPEGTRKPAEWKSGFYRIAVEAGVPILLAAFDYPRKAVRFGPLIQPSGDYEKDLALIRSHYSAELALVPQNYL